MPQLFNCLTAQRTHDWPSIAANARTSTTVTVPGAALGDFCAAAMNRDQLGLLLDAYVSAPNVVTVWATNATGSAVDLASGILRVSVQK